MAASDPTDAARVERAVQLASACPDDWQRSSALAHIARQLAATDQRLATELIERAVQLAGTILDTSPRSEALVGIAGTLPDLRQFDSVVPWQKMKVAVLMSAIAAFAMHAYSNNPFGAVSIVRAVSKTSLVLT
jgi:hypothetical protein